MGSKKKKQSPKKPVPTSPSVDPVTKKRLDLARKLYRDKLRSLNSMSKLAPIRREAMDYDEIRAKRRMTAAVNLFDQVAAVAKPICPDVEGVSDFEYEWLAHNMMPRISFDWNERVCNTVLAAAMWILDQLREYGCFHDACLLFPQDERIFEELELPDIWDTSHDEDALYAVSWIIAHRNDDCVGGKSNSKVELPRPYMDLHTAQGTHRQDVPSRQLFEKILAMIPPQEIQRAVQLFEQTWWDVVRRNYTSRAAHARMQQDIDRRFSEYHQQSKAFAEQMKKSTAKVMQQAMGMTGAVMQQMKAVQSNLPVSAVRTLWRQTSLADLHRKEKEYQDFQLRIQQFQKQEEALNHEQERLEDALVMLVDTMGSILTIPQKQRSEMYFPEAAAAWDDYTISDPYALCFAFLYLLDQGSDLPWAYPISLPLMEQCASVLPWRYTEFEEDPIDIWTHFDEEQDAEVFGHGKTDLPKRIKVPELEDWYGTFYENVREEDPEYRESRNLVQIVYELTGTVMPRNLTRYENALADLDYYGITGKKALHPLLYCMTMLGEVRHRTHTFHLPDEPADAADNSSVEELREKLRKLQAENQQLRQAAYESSRENRELQKKLDASEHSAQADRQELADLRSLVFNRQEDAPEDPTGKVEFPYTAKSRIVVFGGHGSWAKEIKPRLPNVRFIDRTMLPNAQLIRQADTIWIQANALSHAYFFRIITEARKYDIPVRYFSFASAEKCAEQLALADMG